MDAKVDRATWIRVTILVAIVGCIGLLGAALIGILPDILKFDTPVSSEKTQNPMETPLSDNTLFVDNFDSGTTAKWDNTLSTSSFKNGEFFINNGFLISGSKLWQNYSVVADFRLISDNVDFGLVSRLQDPEHLYECQFWHDQIWITVAGDNLAQGTFDWLARNPYNLKVGDSYKARMDVQGEAISCYLNDVLVASAFDSTYSTGRFGIRVFDTEVALDNVEVFKLP